MVKHSIIMPTYNRAHIIERAIKSVLWQSCPDWELIIVADGCKDNTEQIVNSFKDSRIKLIIRKENSEDEQIRTLIPIEPTNDGLRASQGQYISHLDDDDLYRPHRLDVVERRLDCNTNIDAVYCDSIVHYTFQGEETCKLMFSLDFNPEWLHKRNYIRTPEMTYRRSVYKKCGDWTLHTPAADGKTIKPKRQGRVATDWWYWRKMLDNDVRIEHLTEIQVEVFSKISCRHPDPRIGWTILTKKMIRPEWCGQTTKPEDFNISEFYSGGD